MLHYSDINSLLSSLLPFKWSCACMWLALLRPHNERVSRFKWAFYHHLPSESSLPFIYFLYIYALLFSSTFLPPCWLRSMFLFCISLPFSHLCFISTISPAVPLARLSLPSHLLIIPYRGEVLPPHGVLLSWRSPFWSPSIRLTLRTITFYFSFICLFLSPKLIK